MDQEAAFLGALVKAASFRICGPTLELLDSGGEAILTFTETGEQE
jgi:hypothetical protein